MAAVISEWKTVGKNCIFFLHFSFLPSQTVLKRDAESDHSYADPNYHDSVNESVTTGLLFCCFKHVTLYSDQLI